MATAPSCEAVWKSGLLPPEDEAGVDAAKAEGVRHSDANLAVTRLVRYVVEIALGVRRAVVNGRWQNPVLEREDGGRGLDCPGGAEHMASHGLGGAHRQPIGVS